MSYARRLIQSLSRFAAAVVCLTLVLVPTGVTRADTSSGTLFGLAYSSGVEMMVVVDPATGSVTPRGSGFSHVVGVAGNGTAYDAAHHHYFAIMFTTDGHSYLHVIDTTTGALLGRRPLPDSFGLTGLKFDPSSGTLFALSYLAGVETLMAVDPQTGSVTPRGAGFPDVLGVFLDGNTLDSVHHIYYALMSTADGSVYLHAIDTHTGLLRSRNLVPQNHFAFALQTDPASSTIYGIGRVSRVEELIAIDVANGSIAPRGDGFPTANGVPSDGSAIDSTNHRYYVTLDTSDGSHLFTVDTASGAVLVDAPLTGSLYPDFLQFDPTGN